MIKAIRESLRLKWIVFSVLLATLPMAVAGFSIIRMYQENLKKSVIQIEKEKAHMVVERTRAFLEKVTSHLLFLSKEESFRKKDYSRIKEHFKNLLRQSDYLVELGLLNEKGMETIKVSKYKGVTPSELRDRSRTEMFRVGSKGRTYYGDFDVTKDIIPTMVIAVPVEGEREKPSGVLVAQIHLQSVWDVVSEIRIGERGFAYVVDSDGMLISHPDVNRVLMKINMRHLPMVNQVVAGKEGVSEFEHPRGEKFLFVFKPINDLGWGVIVQVPVQEAYKPIKAMTRTAFIWIGVSLFIAVFLSLLFTKRLVHPIKQLSQEMAKYPKEI